VILEASGGGRTAALIKEMEGPAHGLGIQLRAVEVQNPNPAVEQAFRSMVGNRVDALVIAPMPALVPHMRRIVELSTQNHLPTMTASSPWVYGGALMSYGANTADSARRAATYVDRILNGAKPGDLPFEQPTKFEFIINLKTAKQIGLTIPPNVLARADRVIK
jgi:putative tryptophan/tyrosine transport system substrate-binding protein